jgi:hypothetical protein
LRQVYAHGAMLASEKAARIAAGSKKHEQTPKSPCGRSEAVSLLAAAFAVLATGFLSSQFMSN